MRKTLISSLILGTLLFPSALAFAQTTPATTQDVADLESTIKALLLQLIAQLQQQLNDLIAQQAQTTQALGAVQTQMNVVVDSSRLPTSTPKPVSTSIIPIVPTADEDRDGIYILYNPVDKTERCNLWKSYELGYPIKINTLYEEIDSQNRAMKIAMSAFTTDNDKGIAGQPYADRILWLQSAINGYTANLSSLSLKIKAECN